MVMTELSRFKADFFRALAHPLRIRIVDELRSGELTVQELGFRLGAEQSTVSRHLAVLRGRGILNARKEGQTVRYSAADATLFRLLDVARTMFNHQLSELQSTLADLKHGNGR
jgi:DNA-binding transcriptional ArsR family regulator